MLTTRVQWLVLVSALLGVQTLMQGCSGCGGDKDKPRVDGGGDGGSDEDGGDGDGSVGEDGSADGSTDGGGGSDGGSDGGDTGPAPGTPAIRVDGAGELSTSEAGKQATFAVRLNTQPTANVTVPVSSSDPDEGTVGGSGSLTFTPDNWNAPQVVTVTGVDDAEKDGNVKYVVRIGPATSSDSKYAGLRADDVSITNIDDETAGVTVDAAANLQTNEGGGTATFTVVLNTQPSADVSIALASTDLSEGTVAPATLVFTAANWKSPQTATITGVQDDEADGTQVYKISTTASSTDTNYEGIEVADVNVSNVDDDTPGFVVSPATGLATSEGLTEATFTVKLTTKPTANVTISVASSDTTEATVSPASLTFTPDNWNGLQNVTVKGVNDDVADGNQLFTVLLGAAVSSDERYAGIDPVDPAGANGDNDSAGLTAAIPGGGSTLTTYEDGSPQATFTIKLNSQPTANVSVALTTEQGNEVSIAPTTLTFTAADWNSLKTVTLTGVNDDSKDGNKPFAIKITTSSTDTKYNALDIPNITGTNIDNDSAGVRVTAAENLSTRESPPNNQASFTVRLNSKPTGDVAVSVTSGNVQEVTASVNGLTFTTNNWNAPQTVTLTGVNDAVIDGDKVVSIVLGNSISGDPDYNNLSVDDVEVTNVDDDTPGLQVSKLTGVSTSEALTQDSFTVALNTQPTGNVTLNVVSTNTAEATVDVASLTFTPVNWNAPQTVTVTGVNDAVQDGLQGYFIDLGPASSSDTNYNGLARVRVEGANTDNDTAGIGTINDTNLVTSEAGAQATFQVVLLAQPTQDVDIPIVSLTGSEGTAAPGSLHFTPVNWNAPQSVIVTGAEDAIEDGAQDYFIQIGPATSLDANYVGKTVPNVKVSNTDNDTAGITVDDPVATLVVGEGGNQDSFTVRLNSQPVADVTIAIVSSDTGEATVAPATLTFTAVNWASPQTVLVTGRGDLDQDGDQPFTVTIGPAASADPNYNNRAVPSLPGTNVDVDSAAIQVTGNDLVTREPNGESSFTVVLLNQPQTGTTVTIPVVSSDTTEGQPDVVSLVFNDVNWSSPRVVRVIGQNDDIEDGSQPYFVRLGPAQSMDPRYGGRTIPNVRVTNTDDDTAGITSADTAGLSVTEAAGVGHTDTFTFVLNSQPTADVVFTLTSSDATEGVVTTGSLTFNAVNWAAPQTVTLTGVDDFVQDGDPVWQVQTAVASADARYNNFAVANIPVTTVDNDSAGITVNAVDLTTGEDLSTGSIQLVLTSQPVADVVIPVASLRPEEGTVSPASVTFTAGNWNVPQSVTLTGVNDDVQDGPQDYIVRFGAVTSADPNYDARAIADQTATNADNDTAGFTVTPNNGLVTTEAATTATFTVRLTSQPTADVVINLISDDTTEATVSPAALTFTTANWSTAQTVTVTGVDDFVDDNNQLFNIVFTSIDSADPVYDVLTLASVDGSNTDDDTANFIVSPTTATTYEFGVTSTFDVRLTSQPTDDVTITVISSDTNEAQVDKAQLVFTAANWNVNQTVTITGQDDNALDGTKAYTIQLGAATSPTDTVYPGINPTDITGSNVEAAYSCDEWHDLHAAFGSGIFPLDTDRTGPNPVFNAYCDMATDGGGWTLLVWNGDTDTSTPKGVPYPGLGYCAALNCQRGTGVEPTSINALIARSFEFGQGQSAAANFKATYDLLGSYEYAGSYVYPSLTGFAVQGASGACAGFATGVYNDLVGTAGSDGTAVFLNQGFDNGGGSNNNYSADGAQYLWSVGAPGSYCNVNSTMPGSYLGLGNTPGQWGPGVPTASGSYSVWVR